MNEPVTANEIAFGLVLELDQVALERSAEVHSTLPQGIDPDAGPRPGPFVCTEVDGDSSCWSPLTRIPRVERLEIPREWKTGGTPQWLNDPTYLNDGANLYFCTATSVLAACVEQSAQGERRGVTTAGVDAIRAEVAKQERRQKNPR
ncbi:MAG TPA: hypothetical protein VGB13_07745 [Candidatus Krumholzibacteria bacterium]